MDINVHPTKMEVRFSRQEEVYRQVFQAIRQALQQKELIPEVSVSDDASKRSGQRRSRRKRRRAQTARNPLKSTAARWRQPREAGMRTRPSP